MSTAKSDLLHELHTRGYVHQCTDEASLDALARKDTITGYIGFDWEMDLNWTDEEALTDVAFDPCGAFDRPFVYYYLRVTCDSGAQAWTSPVLSINNPNGFHYNIIAEIDSVLLLVGESGFVARSFDAGQSWETLETPYEGSFFSAAGDQHSIVLLGLQGNAVISFDRGESWKQVETGVKRTLTSARVLDDGRLLVSQNGRPLLISNEDRTHLVELLWPAGISVSSFVLGDDRSLFTVGVGGVTRIKAPDFSTKVN